MKKIVFGLIEAFRFNLVFIHCHFRNCQTTLKGLDDFLLLETGHHLTFVSVKLRLDLCVFSFSFAPQTCPHLRNIERNRRRRRSRRTRMLNLKMFRFFSFFVSDFDGFSKMPTLNRPLSCLFLRAVLVAGYTARPWFSPYTKKEAEMRF